MTTTTTMKAATFGAALLAGGLLATPQASAAVHVGIGIGGPGYADPCFGPYPYPYYCRYPVFYGPVFYAGRWHHGSHRYRVIRGHRHYWVGGGWHRARVGHGRLGGPRFGERARRWQHRQHRGRHRD
jgi:hypothetical protein